MTTFFRYNDFRDVVRDLVENKKETVPQFNFSVLAQILGVQKTFLSKVMKGNAQFSSDQIYTLAEFFSLTKEEHDYLILLIEYERTGLEKRKQFLEKRISAIQAEHRNTKKNLKAKFQGEKPNDPFSEYYLDPFMTVAHIFLTLPAYGGDSKKVAQQMNLSSSYAKKIFSTLENLGIIQKLATPNCYRVVEEHLQLSSNSSLITPYHALFRIASTHFLMKIPPEERFAFSVTFSADAKTKTFVHEAFLKFLREIEPVVKAAPSKDVFQLNFDLFPWS
ncbi:MAG: TIGR02147 family protein [Bdellovibrio sp.]